MNARGCRAVILLGMLVALGLSLVRLRDEVAHNSTTLTSPSTGSWAALADDVAHGVLYRPVLSESGYGGTRYMPLAFVIQGGFMRAGLGPLGAGHLVMVLSVAALIAACYQLLRRLGAERLLAACAATLTLTLPPIQSLFTLAVGDVVPTACTFWGLALCLPDAAGRIRLRGAALSFVLAFLAKFTTVYGAGAAVLWFLLSGDRRRAAQLAIYTAGGALVGVGILAIASGGRILAAMTGVATIGLSLERIAYAPIIVLGLIQPIDLLLFVSGALILAGRARPERLQLLPLAVLATSAVTLIIFGSSGTDSNHLIDLEVGFLLLAAHEVARQRVPLRAVATMTTVLAGLAVWGFGERPPSQAGVYDTMLAEARAADGPLFSEHPLLPVLAGDRVFSSDPYLLQFLHQQRPELTADLLAKLDRRHFRAIILIGPHDVVSDERGEPGVRFVPGFIEHLEASYEPKGTYGESKWGPVFYVYVPRVAQAPPPS